VAIRKQARGSHPKERRLPSDIEGFDFLAELALDMRSSWDHATDQVWRQLDPVLWELTHNPWGVLQTVSRDKLQHLLQDATFRKQVDDLVQVRRDASQASAWFQKIHPQSPLKCVAYFSMEFMLGEALPIYSGGLGNVVGDQLKAASDLGVPVIGVGLLYQQGYFCQVIDKDGEQQCQGWLEGYLLTGRHGFFSCYEAFIHIVDSMFNQHAKWLDVTRDIVWRWPIASLNYLLSSHVWRQDHNGFSHQDPGLST
jgi:hypothetical protein